MDKETDIKIKKSTVNIMRVAIVILVVLVLVLGFIALDRTIRVNELVGFEVIFPTTA